MTEDLLDDTPGRTPVVVKALTELLCSPPTQGWAPAMLNLLGDRVVYVGLTRRLCQRRQRPHP
ncbi:hypothetical protein ACFYZ9_38590 [Streptomyces sp. NPDC001691]|uniref:hypothetical protein n=1 Tax=Streptomyces sp. NPDC001691 TaxID=3364600 RepID=UPI0036785046